MAAVDLSRYRQLFLDEATEHVRAMTEELAQGPPFEREAIDSLFRHAHSMKGMAASMQLPPIRDLAHAVEDVFATARDGSSPLDVGLRDAVVAAVDLLSDQVAAYAADRPLAPVTGLRLTSAIGPPSSAATAPAEAGAETAGAAAAAGDDPSTGGYGPTLRIDAGAADSLHERITDLVLNLSSLTQLLGDTAPDPARKRLVSLRRTLDALRTDTMAMRLVPLDSLAVALKRAVRDTASQLDKRVSFRFEGGDVAIDRSILDTLTEPLVHLIRNAVDHGIETADERLATGKSAEGTITLTARREADSVWLSVGDDGRGVDVERLVERAREIGLDLDPAANPADLFELATLPGLSTAREVSDISGRGVGLDLVRARIEGLGGRIEIQSELGVGTTFTLRAPLTLALQRLFLVRIGDATFAVPRARLDRVLEVETSRIEGDTFGLDGDEYRYLRVADALGDAIAPPEQGPQVVGLLIHARQERWMLGVDEVVDEGELVVRPLGRPLQRMLQFSAAAVLPDGSVALVLDCDGLTELASTGALPQPTTAPPVEAVDANLF